MCLPSPMLLSGSPAMLQVVCRFLAALWQPAAFELLGRSCWKSSIMCCDYELERLSEKALLPTLRASRISTTSGLHCRFLYKLAQIAEKLC